MEKDVLALWRVVASTPTSLPAAIVAQHATLPSTRDVALLLSTAVFTAEAAAVKEPYAASSRARGMPPGGRA